MDRAVVWVEDPFGRRRTVFEMASWPNRAGDKVAATVLADLLHFVGAGRTVSALEGAYPGMWRLGWQIDVAAFTAWLQYEHGAIP